MIYKQKVRSFNLLRYSESLIFFSQKSIIQLIEHLFRCRCSCCWRRRSRHFNSFRRSSVNRSSFPTLFFFSRCICIGRDFYKIFKLLGRLLLFRKRLDLYFLSFLFLYAEVKPSHKCKSTETQYIRCEVSSKSGRNQSDSRVLEGELRSLVVNIGSNRVFLASNTNFPYVYRDTTVILLYRFSNLIFLVF